MPCERVRAQSSSMCWLLKYNRCAYYYYTFLVQLLARRGNWKTIKNISVIRRQCLCMLWCCCECGCCYVRPVSHLSSTFLRKTEWRDPNAHTHHRIIRHSRRPSGFLQYHPCTLHAALAVLRANDDARAVCVYMLYSIHVWIISWINEMTANECGVIEN